MWRELWYYMAGGKMAEYDRLKALDVFEFWTVYDLWKDQINREREAAKTHAERRKKI